MKKLFKFKLVFAMFLVFATVCSACNDDEVDAPYTPDKNAAQFINIGDKTHTFDAVGGTYELNVDGNITWNISIIDNSAEDEDWLSVSPLNGKDSVKVTITTKSYLGRVDRLATLKIESDSVSKTFKVVQTKNLIPITTVLLKENCGTTEIEDTPIRDYMAWSKEGVGAYSVKYSDDETSEALKMMSVSKNSPSKGYEGASGGMNLYMSDNGGLLFVNRISTGGVQNYTLSYGIVTIGLGTILNNQTLKVSYSTTGESNSYTQLEMPYTGKLGWQQVAYAFNTATPVDELWVKFEGKDMRIDDILVTTMDDEVNIVVKPILTTAVAIRVGKTTAEFNGSYAETGDKVASAVGFEYKLSSGTEWMNIDVSTVSASFTAKVEGLDFESEYTYRAYAVMNEKKYYGSERIFTTQPEVLEKHSILTIRTSAESGETVAAGTLEGVVVSSFDNQYKTSFAIVDGINQNSGIKIKFNNDTEVHNLAVGDKVSVNISGGVYDIDTDGNLSVKVESLERVSTLSKNNVTAPINISISSLADYESMLVAINDVQLLRVGDALTMNGNKMFENIDETILTVYTHSESSFKDVAIPTKNGTVIGVSNKFEQNTRISPRSMEDLSGLTKDRFFVELSALESNEYIENTIKKRRAESLRVLGLEWDNRELTHEHDKNLKMKFIYKTFGSRPTGGHALYIGMHGGGGGPASMNDEQWSYHKAGEVPKGIWFVPRSPTDTYNMWHQWYMDGFIERIIELAIVKLGVNPNKIYITGFSAGGDGVYQLAPRLADLWAGAAMSAGHPGDAQIVSLRNLPFGLYMGGQDAAYNRNGIAREWKILLNDLATNDNGAYPHQVKIFEQYGHGMNSEDAVLWKAWLPKFERNPIPTKVIWSQDDVIRKKFYWLEADKNVKRYEKVVATYDAALGEVRIEECVPNSITIGLNDKMLNLDNPVKVFFKGREVFNAVIPRLKHNIDADVADMRDAELVFPARLRVNSDGTVKIITE